MGLKHRNRTKMLSDEFELADKPESLRKTVNKFDSKILLIVSKLQKFPVVRLLFTAYILIVHLLFIILLFKISNSLRL